MTAGQMPEVQEVNDRRLDGSFFGLLFVEVFCGGKGGFGRAQDRYSTARGRHQTRQRCPQDRYGGILNSVRGCPKRCAGENNHVGPLRQSVQTVDRLRAYIFRQRTTFFDCLTQIGPQFVSDICGRQAHGNRCLFKQRLVGLDSMKEGNAQGRILFRGCFFQT